MPLPASEVIVTDGVSDMRYGMSFPKFTLRISSLLMSLNAMGVFFDARVETTCTSCSA